MKSRIATVFMLCLFIAATAFASEPVPASKAVRASVVDLVKKKINYPEFAIEQKTQCCVVVSMIIQDNGTLKVDASNSLSPELQNYVVNAIEKIQDKNLAEFAGQKVLINFKFELIS
ncbi:MAG: hypothetical protein Q8O72_09730 [Bacteroidales bacterium]|nr:hypothetical protein [Bacteroidales bacterium]